ncbi:phasin family protein [Methylovirgula sp. 4M-Z18]|uniref:phasin family protein n=1 Tax=Methylovirgula sp. 4M-Z18 TaxID=2293567 RepID=UPI001314EFB2|nr:TIGR01841 family phasin [Methylovirgula sp. 4M-Z18]
MTETFQSYIDMFRKFGTDLGLPKLDVDKLVDMQQKNLDALSQSAQTAAEGAKAVAQKQRSIIEESLREATALAQDFKPLGSPQENIARQTEFAKKVLSVAIDGARETHALAHESSTKVAEIIKGRLKDSVAELSSSVSGEGSAKK